MLTKYEFYPLVLVVGFIAGMLLVKVADSRDFKLKYGISKNSIVTYECKPGIVSRMKMSDLLKALVVVK